MEGKKTSTGRNTLKDIKDGYDIKEKICMNQKTIKKLLNILLK
jgi:hypothetical protein